MLKDILEIFLLTYNRKQKLQETFHQIFKHSSPIKNLDITILNNKSTDGTTELIEMYKKDSLILIMLLIRRILEGMPI